MIEIAHGAGWPIRAAGETIFALLSDDEGPFHIGLEANGWTPQPMESQGNLHFLRVPGHPEGRYKLVSKEGDWFADPNSRFYGYDENGEFSRTRAPEGPHLERWPGVTDGQLAPRTVRVWVPAKKPTHHLYVHDGQNLFNGGWKLDAAAGPSTLVIGIDNTNDRRDEYTHVPDVNDGDWAAGRGDVYADLVRHRIQSLIESRYGQPRKRGVMGSSLGGLISVHIAFRHPNNYDFVGCLSGTLGWGGFEHPDSPDRMEVRVHALGKLRRPKFYFDSGGNPGGGDNYDSTRRTVDAFAEAGYHWDRDLWHWHQPGAKHDEDAWAGRVWRPLELFEQM